MTYPRLLLADSIVERTNLISLTSEESDDCDRDDSDGDGGGDDDDGRGDDGGNGDDNDEYDWLLQANSIVNCDITERTNPINTTHLVLILAMMVLMEVMMMMVMMVMIIILSCGKSQSN